jgi:HSP20 family protein
VRGCDARREPPPTACEASVNDHRGANAMRNQPRNEPLSIESIPELFQGFFRPMRSLASITGDLPFSDVKVDVAESDTAYRVKADLPGLDKKDIDVKIEGNVVSISAKAERNKEVKEGERLIRSERYSGMVSRTFSLDTDIDENAATAQYQDGVLSLTLPKKATAAHKRLQIN